MASLSKDIFARKAHLRLIFNNPIEGDGPSGAGRLALGMLNAGLVKV